jgi:hypothetical protein
MTLPIKYLLNLLLVKNGQSSGSFANATRPKNGQSDRPDCLKERDCIIYKFISAKEYLRGRRGCR